MSKAVAVKADVKATVGTTPFTGAASGAWTAGPISVVEDRKISVGGAAAISQATCTFSFSGVTGSNAPITGSEVVTLAAGDTKLRSAVHVIVDGDAKQSPAYGNKLEATSTRKLKTA